MNINANVLTKIEANKIQEYFVEITGNWLPPWNGRILQRIHTNECDMNRGKCRSHMIISKDFNSDKVHHPFMIKSLKHYKHKEVILV